MKVLHAIKGTIGFFLACCCLVLVILLIGITLIGCTPQKRKPVMPGPSHAPPATATAQPQAATMQPEVTWAVAEPLEKPQEKSARRDRKRTPTMGKGGKTIVYEPGQKYQLFCPEFGAISVILPAGERLQNINSGASGEWKAEPSMMGIAEPIGVIAVSRTPFAPTAELQIITDAAIYQFILIPSQGSVSKGQSSLITVVNPETEARRIEREEARAAAAERERREQAQRVPQAEFSLLGRGQ